MEVFRRSSWLLLLLGVSLLATTLQGVQGEVELEGPSESECRPYIEKALKHLETPDAGETGDSKEDVPTVEITTDDSSHQEGDGTDDTNEEGQASIESIEADQTVAEETQSNQEDTQEEKDDETAEDETSVDETENHETEESLEAKDDETTEQGESIEETTDQDEEKKESLEDSIEDNNEVPQQDNAESQEETQQSQEEITTPESVETVEAQSSVEEQDETKEDTTENAEEEQNDSDQNTTTEDQKETDTSAEEQAQSTENDTESEPNSPESKEDNEAAAESVEQTADESVEQTVGESVEDQVSSDKSSEDTAASENQSEEEVVAEIDTETVEASVEKVEEADAPSTEEAAEQPESEEERESAPEEELSLDIEIPDNLREREHVEHLLKLDEEASEPEKIINRISEITLRELKKLYENAIKPLEVLYKYRDLSNRHFGDSEIFSKPLILFMGPWSGGKSSIINYLLDNEYNETSLRSGAEPSPAYFNILMHGDEPEILDGTQLAADNTFSGLQKFGQGLEERLHGLKLPSPLLEKVNIVEIPGILEVRKQVSRVFPFNDACQWFIDRADIIFLVYDPSKLDVGPETEAILDQLKGREYQTRIILNKADQVKPEELMRVQGALIWNISPLMSSAQPPAMYTTSLWSKPYESWAPVRLLQAQERAFLRDLRSAIDKRIDNKISSARRFAVRVRNHAKMVDCYLTTYYNHKSVFGNRKQVADEIIEHPQDYHIYEGLSTLTNISRYDLPDPDVYKDFFKLNPLYDFQQLSATCTYFRGCPINRLDVAIAYDLPELVGKHKRLVESALAEASPVPVPGS